MLYRLIPSITLLALVLTMTACGEASACPPRPDSPGTYAGWPISIATDHAIYAPGESPLVTVANNSPDGILTTAHDGYGLSCPVVRLQQLVGEQWQEIDDCHSAGSLGNPPPNRGIIITRGRAEISAHVPLPAPGTYRFVVSYGPSQPHSCPCPPPTIVYSAIVYVCTCGVCS